MNRLFLAALLGLCLAPSVRAEARTETGVKKVSRNDGNSRLPFTISCLDSAWTVVGSSKTVAAAPMASEQAAIRRRAMTVQTLGTVTYSVCLSTTSNSSSACDDNIGGFELGAAWGSVSIYDESLWYCRARSGGATSIKGTEFYDSRDEVK